jgi:tRNA-2-methylthio-N6-dimethylallyladenosine synthase
VAVTTDLIVGFPGETEDDFRETMQVVERSRFDAAFTFQYSPRPGTSAMTFPVQVPKEVVQERFDRLCDLQERISLEKNQELVGGTFEVLVEGEGRKGKLQGRTRTNKLIHFEGHIGAGTFADVAVTAAHPHHLDGTLARDFVGAAPPRTR